MKARLPQGYGNQGGMQNALKQAQKMQEEMAAAQEELAARTYTATTGGGMVTATVDGGHLIQSLTIKPEAVDPDDADLLADMITGAVNEAIRQAVADSEQEMSRITGGINLPF